MRVNKEVTANEQPVELSQQFAKQLLQWNHTSNKRQMPWKGEKDPYKIWLSEIILQQTRVEQGLKYYTNFISTFPNVHSLASASDEKVFKAWEGLGYYSRCRNLIVASRFISGQLNGVFPQDYESILRLKGVGPYTAAAIASFAYNLPYAVLDGNVFRVLSRIFCIETPIDSSQGKKRFSALAQKMLPSKKAAEYNQAIMDFGAVICKPSPECGVCFFTKYCQAFLTGRQDVLPVKEKRIKVRERWFNYFVLQCKDEVAIHQRTAKDIWQNLHEFLLIETDKASTNAEMVTLFEHQHAIKNYHVVQSQQLTQQLSHQLISFSFLHVQLKKKQTIPGFTWIKKTALHQLAFPKTLQQFHQSLQ